MYYWNSHGIKKWKIPSFVYIRTIICCLCWSPDRFFGECNVMLATYSVDVLWSNPNCKIRSRTFTYWSFCRWNVDLGGLSSTLPPTYLLHTLELPFKIPLSQKMWLISSSNWIWKEFVIISDGGLLCLCVVSTSNVVYTKV